MRGREGRRVTGPKPGKGQQHPLSSSWGAVHVLPFHWDWGKEIQGTCLPFSPSYSAFSLLHIGVLQSCPSPLPARDGTGSGASHRAELPPARGEGTGYLP